VRSPGRETVTVLTLVDGAKDRLGVAGRTWSPSTVPGCSFQPVSATEANSNVDLTVTMWRLYAPPTLQLTSRDRVQVGPDVFEVFGDPQLWRDARGRPQHVQALLRKARG
jgi:hypothetical protein